MPAVGPAVRREAALLHFAGRAGDHNDRAMVGSRELAAGLAARLRGEPTVVGSPEPALSTGWAEELSAAAATLRAMAARLDETLARGLLPVTALSRCAVALATVPVVAAHRPDAVVVWFDAHADLNTPDTTTTGYLGGLALSGPMGLWSSGLGDGLEPRNAVVVGARDIDPPEQELLDAEGIAVVTVGPGLPEQLRRVVAGRPVYLHLDCDVLEPGIVPTDYLVPGGMTLADLRSAARVLADCELVGLEIAELESQPDAGDPPAYVDRLLDALDALLTGLT